MDANRLMDLLEYCERGGDPDQFVEHFNTLVDMLRSEIDFQESVSDRFKPPSRWDAKTDSLLKQLRELDPRLRSYIRQLEANFYGADAPDSIVRLVTVLEGGPLPKGTPWMFDERQVCMKLVAGFCHRWGLSVEKSKLCGFYVLMETLLPELGVSWDIYKLADITMPHYKMLTHPDGLQQLSE